MESSLERDLCNLPGWLETAPFRELLPPLVGLGRRSLLPKWSALSGLSSLLGWARDLLSTYKCQF